jgi:SAM-dependent methyltransferase
MNANDIKETVKDHYGRIARGVQSGCGSGCGCGSKESVDVTAAIVPSYAGHDEAVVETANLGLGCGDPVRFSGLREGMTVLDLGSGGGIDVFLAAREVGEKGRSIGLDMTDEMLERAEKNRQKLGIPNAFFVKGEIENIPLPGETVDWILSNCVINLVPDKKKAFAEMHRVLRDGGSFVISDIVTGEAVPDRYRTDTELWAGCVSGATERTEYIGMIREAGFARVEILSERPASETGNLPFSVQSITVKATKGR